MKNFLAVIAGLAFTIAIAVGLDYVMHNTGVFSYEASDMTTSDWLLAMSYRLVGAIGGGWITAKLAQSRPLFLAIVLGIIGTVIGLAGLLVAWQARGRGGRHGSGSEVRAHSQARLERRVSSRADGAAGRWASGRERWSRARRERRDQRPHAR